MKILLAIDGSPFSNAAVDAVSAYLWPKDSELKVISVVETQLPIAPEPFGVGVDFALEIQNLERTQAEQAVEEAVTKIRASENGKNLDITSALPTGSPKRVIVEEAEEWGSELIVIGSHGYHFWERMLLGSVSLAVAQHAKCSVLIVRCPNNTNSN